MTAYDFATPVDGQPVLPPRTPLVAAGFSLVLAALTIFSGSAAGWLIGYALAGLVSIACVVAFRYFDQRRRSSPWYAPHPSWSKIAVVFLVLGVGLAVVNAWQFADWVAS